MKSRTGLIVGLTLIAVAAIALGQQNSGGGLVRLPTLQAQYEARVRADVEEPFLKGLAELNTRYGQALDQAFRDAQSAGNLKETLAVKAEIERAAKGEALPADDAADLPTALLRLRTGYRQSYDLLATRKGDGQANLRKIYVAELQKIVAELTKQGDLSGAQAVQKRIDEQTVAANAAGAATAPGGPVPSPRPGTVGVVSDLQRTTKEQPFINSLGMKFVPVPGTKVLFCIHETRYKDYAAYASGFPGVDDGWKDQTCDGYALTERNEDHPVIRISWDDAKAFCEWLSKKEGKTYRLPTDEEWSIAVGLGSAEKHSEGTTPATFNGKESTEFPWGGDFPPKTRDRVGNYGDESRKAKAPISGVIYLDGYDDGYPTTAPVMSYQPNKLGLYDLGGNMWEWCEDWYDAAKQRRVLRGGAWRSCEPSTMLSSIRDRFGTSYRHVSSGFRPVLVIP